MTAQGPGAAALVAGHEVAETLFGNDTPFTRLVERRGYQVYFGDRVGPTTMYHAYESPRDPPYSDRGLLAAAARSPLYRRRRRSSYRATLVHDPRVLAGRFVPTPAVRRSCGATWSPTGCAR